MKKKKHTQKKHRWKVFPFATLTELCVDHKSNSNQERKIAIMVLAFYNAFHSLTLWIMHIAAGQTHSTEYLTAKNTFQKMFIRKICATRFHHITEWGKEKTTTAEAEAVAFRTIKHKSLFDLSINKVRNREDSCLLISNKLKNQIYNKQTAIAHTTSRKTKNFFFTLKFKLPLLFFIRSR